MPLLSPLYLERDPVSVIQGLFSFNLLYKLLPLYSLMRHFGVASAAPSSRQSLDGFNIKSFRIKRFLTLLPSNESVQLRLRFTTPTFGASPHKKIDWNIDFQVNLNQSLNFTTVVLAHAALRLRGAAPQSRQSPDGSS